MSISGRYPTIPHMWPGQEKTAKNSTPAKETRRVRTWANSGRKQAALHPNTPGGQKKWPKETPGDCTVWEQGEKPGVGIVGKPAAFGLAEPGVLSSRCDLPTKRPPWARTLARVGPGGGSWPRIANQREKAPRGRHVGPCWAGVWGSGIHLHSR